MTGNSEESPATVADREITNEPLWSVAGRRPSAVTPSPVELPSVLSVTGLLYPRKHCLMIFHVPESENSDPQIRYEHNVGFLQSLFDMFWTPMSKAFV